MLGLTFFSKLDWGLYIFSIAKTVSKKTGALIRSMKFLSPEVCMYLYKSTIHPFMEYCCQIWAGAPSCYLELLGKLQKQICRAAVPSLATSFETLADRWAKLEYFLCITLVDVHLNRLNWFCFSFFEGGQLAILLDCMIFLSPFLNATRMPMLRVSFHSQLDSEFSVYRMLSFDLWPKWL